MNLKCDNVECIQDRQEILEAFPLPTDINGVVIDDSDDDDDDYQENNCRNEFIHCEMPGCHSNYWRDKNGSTCSLCERENCEGCTDDGGYEDSDEEDSFGDDWLCKEWLTFGAVGHADDAVLEMDLVEVD